jgi:putative transposase
VERAWLDGTKPVFVTFRVAHGLRLRDFALAAAIGKTFRSLATSEREGHFRIAAFCLLDDHVHLLVEARDRVALSSGMRAVSIRLAKAVNRCLGRRGRVVTERYHARQLTSPTETRRVLVYVFQNGRKHGAPDHEFADGLDTRSSARWFDGWLDHTPDASPAPVARARTFMLTRGWRKLGLLDRRERPASS